jgi:hypothetical protein
MITGIAAVSVAEGKANKRHPKWGIDMADDPQKDEDQLVRDVKDKTEAK